MFIKPRPTQLSRIIHIFWKTHKHIKNEFLQSITTYAVIEYLGLVLWYK